MGKSVYIAAIIATILIVIVLFVVVTTSESSKASQFNDEIRQFALENELQSAYLDFDVNNREVYCTIINQGIENLSKRSDTLEKQLAMFKDNSVSTNEFFLVKRNYLMTNMILYRSFLKSQESCDLNKKAVLFFYAEDNSCEVECGVIGSQINELRKTCDSFRAFNFPYAWPSYEFTQIIEKKYGVTRPGTIVIDGNKINAPVGLAELSKEFGCQ